MAYIGKSPAQVKRDLPEKDTFTGDGSTTTFDLTNDALSANTIQVFVDNVRQEPGTGKSYTLGEDGSGNLRRITFTAAPDSSADIYVINPGTRNSVLNTLSDGSVTEAKLGTGAVTSAKISDGTIANADVSPSAAIVDSKLAEITTASKVNVSALSAPGSSSLFLRGDRTYAAIPTDQIDTNAFNISLLGFKMAVNEGLTVFNLVDGVVDEFHDESGTDEAEGSNDLYNATDDFYINSTQPDGLSVAGKSAGFTTNSITEPDTSTAGNLGAYLTQQSLGTFTVPCGTSSVNAFVWGAGGGGSQSPAAGGTGTGGGGGFTSGVIGVTGSQVLKVSVGEGGWGLAGSNCGAQKRGGGGLGIGGGNGPDPSGSVPYNVTGPDPSAASGAGGGLSAITLACVSTTSSTVSGGIAPYPGVSAPQIVLAAGAGGGFGYHNNEEADDGDGGGGGGLTGYAGSGRPAQTNNGSPGSNSFGGGGDQEQGGQGGTYAPGTGADGQSGSFLTGGNNYSGGHPTTNVYVGGGGAGFYGGGGASMSGGNDQGGGGGSSYYGHPQITSGATEDAQQGGAVEDNGGGQSDPNYVANTNWGARAPYPSANAAGSYQANSSSYASSDGYVLLTVTPISASATSTTIVSTAFTASSVPTTSRIVVFEENVDTPTLNTDIIASISRDGGSTFTTATLSDSGYVTGSSGQRILTGQATISGQPSGQSMRWKLALANNAVKIHGVSLQWS